MKKYKNNYIKVKGKEIRYSLYRAGTFGSCIRLYLTAPKTDRTNIDEISNTINTVIEEKVERNHANKLLGGEQCLHYEINIGDSNSSTHLTEVIRTTGSPFRRLVLDFQTTSHYSSPSSLVIVFIPSK